MKYNPKIVSAFFESFGIPKPEFEHGFHEERKWRFDLAWPNQKIALEVDGGIWVNGGHNRGAQMKKEWEKSNTAASLGWRILKCEPKDLCMESTAKIVMESLNTGIP